MSMPESDRKGPPQGDGQDVQVPPVDAPAAIGAETPETFETVVTPSPFPDPETSPVLVLTHCFDEDRDVYRLVIGRRVFVPATDTTEEIPLGTADELDFVFDAGDERWFTSNGTRRPEKDIAAEQKELVRAALAEQAEAAERRRQNSRDLPGVGEELF